jgi:acyl-coenzyme A thioesterase PaaI-like protein
MVLACGGHVGEMIPVGTVTLDTQFLRPASGEGVRAEAEVTRAGRSMIFARCTLIVEPSEKPVALATATFAR